MPAFVLMTRVVRVPRRIRVSKMLLVCLPRFLPVSWRPTEHRPCDEHSSTCEHHRDAEMLRADLIQDEYRKQKNRQHEIQQDDLESGHGCTFAAGELGFSVAPEARACAEV